MTNAPAGLRLLQVMSPREYFLYALLSVSSGRWVPREAERVRARAEWTRDEVRRLQTERLQTVLRHAAGHVPYYRALLAEAAFDVNALSEPSAIQQIPVLDRERLQRNFAALRSPAVADSDVSVRTTGGTTGQPVKVLLENRNSLERTLVTHRLYSMMGRRPGDRTLLIAGSPIDVQRWTSWKEQLKNLLNNVTVSSSFSLTPDRLQALIGGWQDGRYRVVIAYASVFDVLAAHVERHGQTLPRTAIVPCAELVTSPQRQRWERLLNAEVFELYGSREMPSIAGETVEHEGLIVSDDIYYVEVTDTRGVPLPIGTPGLITITSLLEIAMPLIRYQLGDVGVMLPPARNSGFSRLRVTHGRVLDLISCPNGKVLPGEFFPHLFKEVSVEVTRYQVVQEDLRRLCVSVVATPAYSEATTEYLRRKIFAQVGSEVSVEFHLVSDIPLSASGKYRPTISKVPFGDRLWRQATDECHERGGASGT